EEPAMTAKAVVLLSGGLDSTTTLALARREGFALYALTFRYGQRHAAEVEAARRIARHYAVADHKVVDIDLRLFGGAALTRSATASPSPTCRRATRSFCPTPWPGPRCWAAATSSSASMPSIIRD